MKTEPELQPWPWPFPQWDGTRWVMPMELMPKELRKKRKEDKPNLDDIEEALF